MERTKVCTKCGKEKPLSSFSKHRLSPDGHAYQCKECNAKRAKEWRKTTSAIYTNIKGRSNHYKRKGSKFYKPLNISKEDFIEWYESQERVCAYCDIPEEKMKLIAEDFDGRVSRLQVDSKDNDIGYNYHLPLVFTAVWLIMGIFSMWILMYRNSEGEPT